MHDPQEGAFARARIRVTAAGDGGFGQSEGLGGMTEVQGLVRLGPEDMASEGSVVGFGRQPKSNTEPLLGEGVLGGVEGGPARQVCQFAGSSEHLLPRVVIRESAAEVAGDVGPEVGDEGGAAVLAAAALFALGKQLCHLPYGGNVVRSDLPSVRRLP